MNNFNLYHTSNFTEFKYLDLYLAEIIGLKTNGYFIEIGAFDGQTNSKTARLADIGWEGIYVEPIKEYAEKCKARHEKNNVDVVNAAIGDRDGQQIMHKSGMPSTLVEENRNHLEEYLNEKGSSFNFKDETVEVFSWTSFLKKYVKNKKPELFILDAEGYDLKILNSIDFSTFRPKIICTEVFPESTAFMHQQLINDGKKIVSTLKENGYHIWVIEDHNVLFVDKKHLPIKLNDFSNADDFSLFKIAASILNDNIKSNIENFITKRGIDFFSQIIETLFILNQQGSAKIYLEILEKCIGFGKDQVIIPILIMAYLKIQNWNKLESLIHHFKIDDNLDKNLLFMEAKLHLFKKNYSQALQLFNLLIETEPFNKEYSCFQDLVSKALYKQNSLS